MAFIFDPTVPSRTALLNGSNGKMMFMSMRIVTSNVLAVEA